MVWMIVTKRKEDLKTALEEQLELGEDGLEEEDKFLLEINLDELEASSGEDQTYWLLALEAARDARLLRAHQEGESGE